MLVAVVTGSRDWRDSQAIHDALAGAEALIVGDCPTGADAIAYWYADFSNIIPIVCRCKGPARTPENLKARNEDIARTAALYREDGFDVQCFAFPLKGSGTWHCVGRLRKRNFHVKIIGERR